ncbi:MAG: hypothetical protein AB1442_02235 [Nitrospirota bacterium]
MNHYKEGVYVFFVIMRYWLVDAGKQEKRGFAALHDQEILESIRV